MNGYFYRQTIKGIFSRISVSLAGIAFGSFLTTNAQAHQEASWTMWYRQPAPVWNAALPVGNGRLGAMVFGGANEGDNNGDSQEVQKNAEIASGKKTRGQDEHLQLNESTVWAGSRADRLNPQAADGFRRARALLLESKGTDGKKIEEAEKIAQETMLAIPRGMPPYSTLGDLYLRSTDDRPVTSYRRQLDLRTGLVRITYRQAGANFVREVFASAVDQVLVVHIKADRPGSVSFVATMDRPADFETSVSGGRDLILTQSAKSTNQIRFQAQTRILTAGGTVRGHGNSIEVNHADEVTLLIAAATDFRGGPIKGGDPAAADRAVLEAAEHKQYGVLRRSSTEDVMRYMTRMHLRLGGFNAQLEASPTDERLKRVSEGGDDPGLQTLYFQFARYLLTGSSRPGGLPANLQGLWASGLNNPWGSKWTVNINTEMNYWLAEPANLSELHKPLFDLIRLAADPASGTATRVAKDYYGANGFVIHHNLDIWGDSEPIDGYQYGIWPNGGAWLTLHAWDHYAFTGDRVFLRNEAWPLLRDVSQFFLDYLVDDGAGHLVTGPSFSPENRYKLPDGTTHSLTMAPTMDIEIVKELFERALQAGKILDADEGFLNKLQAATDKLPPFKIGSAGQLQEWQLDYEDADPGHRHISHLWGLFPGTQIDLKHTPELARAAQTTLEHRLAHGGGQTGWSRAWVVNYWNHLHRGDLAFESLQVLLRQSTFPNLMDTHPPGVFQIDGNLGGSNGMLESVVQSRWYPEYCEVDLLPALPAQWPEGTASGIRIRGNQQLDISWRDGKLTVVTWRAESDGAFRIAIPKGQKAYLADRQLNRDSTSDEVTLHAQKGRIYRLIFR